MFCWQYFSGIDGVSAADVGRYGGSVSLADYCPYLQEFVWKQDGDLLRGSRCALDHNAVTPEQNFLLETYGSKSACFLHGSEWMLKQCGGKFLPHSGSGCYEYSCDPVHGLQVHAGSAVYTCHYAGQQLYVEYADHRWLHQGNITCPSCQEMCQVVGSCSNFRETRIFDFSERNFLCCY